MWSVLRFLAPVVGLYSSNEVATKVKGHTHSCLFQPEKLAMVEYILVSDNHDMVEETKILSSSLQLMT